ncbi:hypothetical protein MBLNU459_g5598t1 [Dothideomycetes sp. NU459]
MMKIQSLLNCPPSPEIPPPCSSLSPPPTPAYSNHASSIASTPPPNTPMSTSTPTTRLRQKMAKDAAIFHKNPVKGDVNYAPYECLEKDLTLTNAQRQDLREQHRRFCIYPSGGEEGLIGDYVRHVPYSSDKKTFSGKTGRDAFELFQYTFCMPDEPDKSYVVMWDYQVGLVRITPFFKACNFPKTTPNKVLGLNPGLRELAHSITGGAIAAQGYWMPYSCARAMCATFCWDLRWALTPIFGPSFLRDCIPPSSPNYQSFRIATEVIRVCQREAEGWKCTEPHEITPTDQHDGVGHGATTTNTSGVTSAPHAAAILSPKRLRPRKQKGPLLEDPFGKDFEDEDAVFRGKIGARIMSSPSVSPKTKVQPLLTTTSPTVATAAPDNPKNWTKHWPKSWMSVNKSRRSPSAVPPLVPLAPVVPFSDARDYHFTSTAAEALLLAKQQVTHPNGTKRALSSVFDEETNAEVEVKGQNAAKKAKLSRKFHSRDFNAAQTLLMLHAGDRLL